MMAGDGAGLGLGAITRGFEGCSTNRGLLSTTTQLAAAVGEAVVLGALLAGALLRIAT